MREFKHAPFGGTGSGTFQVWWTRDGDIAETVVDTHSLYLQTLGELGLVGFALLAAFIAGQPDRRRAGGLRAGAARRSLLAAALAGTTALWVTSLFDWMWKLPVIPIATLMLVAVLLTAEVEPEQARAARAPLWLRGATVLVALIAIVAIAIPLASTAFLRKSQDAARPATPPRPGRRPHRPERDARRRRPPPPGSAAARAGGPYGEAADAAKARPTANRTSGATGSCSRGSKRRAGRRRRGGSVRRSPLALLLGIRSFTVRSDRAAVRRGRPVGVSLNFFVGRTAAVLEGCSAKKVQDASPLLGRPRKLTTLSEL